MKKPINYGAIIFGTLTTLVVPTWLLISHLVRNIVQYPASTLGPYFLIYMLLLLIGFVWYFYIKK